ncbi:MAG TPA: hypothetical protein PKY59_23430 [Pyrinomonadaceae bacterium]|nr:hypothetical protein [Pyrinomonadaceae bacterium]
MQKQQFLFNLTNEIGLRRNALIKLIFLMTAIFLCGTLDAAAQKTRTKKNATTVAKNVEPKKTEKIETNDAVNSNIPVAVINSAETDFLSGEASVNVNPKQPTVVRLGLAQNAVSIVEFPASDGVYYIHEGNPKLVSVFQSPTKESDRSITIYPGEGFVTSAANPSATITLQMRSGLILILEFVPVSEIKKNAHRCVINYDREEVIAARRTAGLAYNLGEEIRPTNNKNTRANSKLVTSTTEETTVENNTETDNNAVRLVSFEVTRGSISRKSEEKPSKNPKTGLELSRLVNKRLADCLKNPAKNLGAWTAANNGLSLAVSSVSEIDAEQRLVIIAVRNDSTANLRLIPGTPELQIKTLDEQGNALQTERLERIYVETTSAEGLVLPGSTIYYALVYKAPVMGKSQRLSVLVSHREAADSPTTIALPNINETTKE